MAKSSRVGIWVAGIVLIASLGGCQRSEPPAAGAGAPAALAPPAPGTVAGDGQKAEESTPADARKLVRKASLELEVESAKAALARATRIAESQGGFVATSEQSAAGSGRGERTSVTLSLRVPSDHFVATLEALRKLGAGPGSERVSTEDVSEEFIDLEARIKNQRALETQFLEIMKQATKVEDALRVQREIAAVRTEIDRMEGRRRFLERETSLATITLQLVPAQPIVGTGFGEFGRAMSQAASDSVSVGAGIITGVIRLVGVLVPLAVLLGLAGSARAALPLEATGRARSALTAPRTRLCCVSNARRRLVVARVLRALGTVWPGRTRSRPKTIGVRRRIRSLRRPNVAWWSRRSCWRSRTLRILKALRVRRASS
jgi:hypothetical protein